MALISFPDIPKYDGVPAIPRSPNFPPSVRAGLGLVQGVLWRSAQVRGSWGIWDSEGNPLGDPAKFTGLTGGALEAAGLGSTLSTGSIAYSKETRVSDFPVEKGEFASYNKVEMAAAPVVTLFLQGTESNRRTFLEAIEKACKSTDLYSVITPEIQYIGYSLERYNYQRRSSKGATLLIVEISLKEVREVSTLYATVDISQIESPQDVGAALKVDSGKVQAQKPKDSTFLAIVKKIPSLADTVSNQLQGLVN